MTFELLRPDGSEPAAAFTYLRSGSAGVVKHEQIGVKQEGPLQSPEQSDVQLKQPRPRQTIDCFNEHTL